MTQRDILQRVKNGELSIDDANLMLDGLNSNLPIDRIWDFSKFMSGWTQHSSGRYFYKSKDHSQWPPDETATKDELIKRYFG